MTRYWVAVSGEVLVEADDMEAAERAAQDDRAWIDACNWRSRNQGVTLMISQEMISQEKERREEGKCQ